MAQEPPEDLSPRRRLAHRITMGFGLDAGGIGASYSHALRSVPLEFGGSIGFAGLGAHLRLVSPHEHAGSIFRNEHSRTYIGLSLLAAPAGDRSGGLLALEIGERLQLGRRFFMSGGLAIGGPIWGEPVATLFFPSMQFGHVF